MSKMSPDDVRYFDGKRYMLVATVRKKSNAKARAKSIRKYYNARVVKGKTPMHKPGWHVYKSVARSKRKRR